ncbi:M3 family metallopeptidase [Kocuria rosea]|uniref:M3 family metallopeptidase n=1 Tax=Kocuria rosea TaxID=1275 RepID=UPI0020404306|nr:M3 family metallopeptidase [Kocuria rosea]MCM3688165.1 M3 family metallopeptidase [Kocuria rosea]HST72189.1 M3 family metallopeptidase [Kocuria rosea]
MDNPLLRPSDLPYELPDFGRLREEHFLPAFEAAMAHDLANVEAVLTDPAAPTFANTVEVLERGGLFLDRVESVFFTLTAAHNTPGVQRIYEQLAPRLSKHKADFTLNKALYHRVRRVDRTDLEPWQVRALDEYLSWFQRSGVELTLDEQAQLRRINDELSALSIRFGNDLIQEVHASAVLVEDPAELDGMAEADVEAAALAAAEQGHPGRWLLTPSLFTVQPALSVLTDRALRRRIHLAAVNRGTGARGGPGSQSRIDLLPVAARIAALRAEQSELLGCRSHAEYVMQASTAPSPEAVHEMLERVSGPAVRNALEERAELEALAGHRIEAWDWPFWAERARRERFAVDTSALREWFELESVLEQGIFRTARELYGLVFTERPDLRGYLPEVRVWEVTDERGRGVGLFLGDWFTRSTKQGGAWMGSLVHQNRLTGQRPVVVNNANFTPPPAGSPKLLTLDEVVTVFHEFGHALHGLLSDVHLPSFSGTKVPRDFVEYPSQVHEMWALHPDVAPHYARHHVSGEPLPEQTLEALRAAAAHGQGFRTVEYLASTCVDLAWHGSADPDGPPAPHTVEAGALARAGLDVRGIDPRYRTGYFKHVFAGGYSAGYWSYLWSEILDADTAQWFTARGGLTRDNGRRFAAEVLSRGNETAPMEAFEALLGRGPHLRALLERRGLLPREQFVHRRRGAPAPEAPVRA